MSKQFEIKDSGKRQQFSTGMQRDTTEDKINYLLIHDGPMYERWAIHLTNGAKKYDARNWMKAATEEELERALESATRHFEQWLHGDKDEDHGAAVFFNINLAEYIYNRLCEANPIMVTLPKGYKKEDQEAAIAEVVKRTNERLKWRL